MIMTQKQTPSLRNGNHHGLPIQSNHEDVVQHEYTIIGQTITEHFLNIFTAEGWNDEKTRKLKTSVWPLHCDNAPAHSSCLVQNL